MSRTLSSWKQSLGGVLAASLLVAGCESPTVVPTADGRQNIHSARIEGNLVVQSRSRGNAVVFIYDASRPPPPQGTGRPIAFTVVPAEQLFGPALGTDAPGPFTAPFALSLVAAGKYTLRGFIDVDSCRTGVVPCHFSDFNPWYGVTSEPNAGDVGGAAVDPTNGVPLTLEVTKDAEGNPLPLTNVTVSFSQATAQVPVDRPAFQVTVLNGDHTLPPGSPTKLLRLTPQSIEGGAVEQRSKAFLVSYVDANRDGVPDDANGDGAADLWPRVVVRKLADAPGLLEDNDLDRNGILDEGGTDYPHADGTRDGKPDLVVLAAGLSTDALFAALTDENGAPRMTPVPVTELVVGVQAAALDASDPTKPPARLETLPRGRYSVVLIQSTGQTWRVPNELAPAFAAGLGLTGVESQAFVLEVP
ncbi:MULTISPECIES: hypothetical protein [Myxococcus]|uniref:hypothetical protein n=1 Tax=Myxococcus TaxID=32 RepID=UPI0013D24555|nr:MULTISPECIES: hypothetical protein [Myxococcus]NVJ25512.1 hypothetical protein [Myxococcus sp. AM011]